MGTGTAFRNYLAIGIMNTPGPLLGAAAIEMQLLGRRRAMGLATALAGVFLFLCATIARPSAALLGWNDAYAVASSMMYGVLYGALFLIFSCIDGSKWEKRTYTSEVFPTQHRGTGNGLASTAKRVGGTVVTVIAMCTYSGAPVAVFVAGSLFLVSAALMVSLLPLESRGKSCL